MKLGPVTKPDKGNTTASKKFIHEVITANCGVIVFFFPIYGKFGVIQKLDSGGLVCKTYFFINCNLLCYKN